MLQTYIHTELLLEVLSDLKSMLPIDVDSNRNIICLSIVGLKILTSQRPSPSAVQSPSPNCLDRPRYFFKL